MDGSLGEVGVVEDGFLQVGGRSGFFNVFDTVLRLRRLRTISLAEVWDRHFVGSGRRSDYYKEQRTDRAEPVSLTALILIWGRRNGIRWWNLPRQLAFVRLGGGP